MCEHGKWKLNSAIGQGFPSVANDVRSDAGEAVSQTTGRRRESSLMRTLLFVPADSERKLEKSLTSDADCLLLDLEDAVALSAKPKARQMAVAFLQAAKKTAGHPLLYVRVNSLDSSLVEADLAAIMQGAPDGILLPKSGGGADLQHLGVKLAVLEAENGLPDGTTKIIALATETAASLFEMGTYAGASRRLAGMTWGAEDLAADLGAETNRMPDGGWTSPFQWARALTLFAARSAEVPAIDTVYANFRDLSGLRGECEAARRDGFSAKMALHPDQVGIINEIFTPSAEAIAKAQAIVAAFAKDPQTGVIGLDGEMLDQPHLARAQRLLARASRP
jgi:citrate lyase subunit beta / citryl-CoA lyase